ncbi:MAG TPA: HAD hydrolase-like protein, partial [Gammaproteobacteria bacterium]|nr:HAD hydrolase-like protein [Gammaproteobacteria bacterium]
MAILFDLDGTLLDTSRDFHIAINKVLHAENRPKADYDKLRDAISFGSKRIIQSAINEHLTDADCAAHTERMLPQFLEEYASTGFAHTHAF